MDERQCHGASPSAVAYDTPSAERLRREFPNGSAYCSWLASREDNGRSVSFCWSDQCNESGFFLGWRQTLLPPSIDGGISILTCQDFFGLLDRRRVRAYQHRQALQHARLRGDREHVARLLDPTSRPTPIHVPSWLVSPR